MRFGRTFAVHELEVMVGVDPADRVSRLQSSGLLWDEVGVSNREDLCGCTDWERAWRGGTDADPEVAFERLGVVSFFRLVEEVTFGISMLFSIGCSTSEC